MTCGIAVALKLALVTGQRIGEVVGMSLSELTLSGDAPVWTIPARRTKNDRLNRVPLSPLALQLIAEARSLAAGSEWLFPAPSGHGPINPHAPTRAVARSRHQIGISDFRVHDLRRSVATGMAELGIAPHTISWVLNHISATRGTITSKVYAQYGYDREKRHALEAWSRRLSAIVGGAYDGLDWCGCLVRTR